MFTDPVSIINYPAYCCWWFSFPGFDDFHLTHLTPSLPQKQFTLLYFKMQKLSIIFC